MISVVIPVKNGGSDLVRCLEGIRRQIVDERIEIVVVDSGSTDGSADVARNAGALVREIPAEQFGSDNWHFQGVHGSMGRLGQRNEDINSSDSFHAWTEQGHMAICIAPRIEAQTLLEKTR